MSWISVLYETYNNCSSAIADDSDGLMPLLPVSHSTAQAQVEVKIDLDGNFIGADVVARENANTIIPVTEDSCTRSSGIAPHPLCDKLCYTAGDYDRYVQSKKPMSEYYSRYIDALKEWNDSEYTTEKVCAVYKYLGKGRIIADLVATRLFETDESGFLSAKKIEGVAQADCFVRFIIYSDDFDYVGETWKDKRLFESYIKYYDSQKQDRRLCYILGEAAPITEKHPAKIRHTGDKAKLVSSNDSVNFTYRGRFLTPTDAATVSYEVSQKAHNVLKWLIAKQGYRNDSNYIVCWSVGGEKMPRVWDSSDEFIDDDEPPNTSEAFAKSLNKAIAGYEAQLDTKARIVVMSVDTADGSTNGRLAIKTYTELSGSQFLDNIKSWYSSCNWQMMPTKKQPSRVATPSPRELAIAAYGIERENMVDVDAKLLKNTVERSLPCIIQKGKFPRDILQSAVNNVSRASGFSNYNHQRLIAVTCAMIKKCEYGKDEDVMALNTNENDRSYLFGRLLAIADVLEERTYNKDEKRTTNAARYWSAFAARPAKTWNIITDRLRPYMDKCDSIGYYNILLAEVHSLFKDGDFSDEKLSPKYILGYWCQRNTLYKKNDNKEEEN